MNDAAETVAKVLTESVLTIAEAIVVIEKTTHVRPHRGTIHRWIKRGMGGVKLEAVRVGNQTLTSAQAINRFITARTAAL